MKKIIYISAITILTTCLLSNENNNESKFEFPKAEESDNKYNVLKLEKECKEKKLTSCNRLGFVYVTGKGVKRDINKALDLFQISCKGGYDIACVNEAMTYKELDKPKYYAKQKELLEYTCEFNEFSCLALGEMYYHGKGVKQDRKKTKELYKKACDMGSKIGCIVYKQMK